MTKRYDLQVFDKDNNLIGYCAVVGHQVEGKTFVVCLAEESEVCQACGVKHTDFRELIYDLCFIGGDVGLMVRSIDDAKHLPGFKEA